MFSNNLLNDINRQRLYKDWSIHSDLKCAKSREQMRTQKIIDSNNLNLEARRDKLRIIFDKESATNMKACADKLKFMESLRQQSVIDEAANLKKFIKCRNTEIAKRELDRQMKLNCMEFRLAKKQLIEKSINEDQVWLKDFKASQKAYDHHIDEKMNQSDWGFVKDICNNDIDRSLVKCVREHETQDLLRKEILLKDKVTAQLAKDKIVQGIETVKKMEDMAEMERSDAAHKYEKRIELRQAMEDQIKEIFDRIQEKKDKNKQFEIFLNQHWFPDDVKVDRNKKMHILNKEAHHFLHHQAQINENQKCIDKELVESVHAMDKKNREISCERDRIKREFLKQLEAETYESRRQAADLKVHREMQEKEMSRVNFQKNCEEMDKRFAELDAREAKKSKEAKIIQDALMIQLKDRQQRSENLKKALLIEREGYKTAENEFRDKCKETADLKDLNLHPWRKKFIGIPSDQNTSLNKFNKERCSLINLNV